MIKISELIGWLEQDLADYGDLDVCIAFTTLGDNDIGDYTTAPVAALDAAAVAETTEEGYDKLILFPALVPDTLVPTKREGMH